eukprot:TRINITY_DN33503_c0_g1_i1.p1 TRINITY_DN33503_c0_g1~~TRINITY_DN33503_c0_g1_i1.p1  ORF type:complete len:549 (-),score=115.63 TRINITY_DN33503_c0_g1_i1:60-1706(-)
MALRQLHVLHLNDLYHVDDHEGKSERALRMLLAMEPYIEKYQPLITFGGDLFAPSLMSTLTKGKHMMEVLELLGVHVATLGNHDFDFGVDRARELTQKQSLFDLEGPAQRAKSKWVLSNIDGRDGEPLAGSQRWWLEEWNGIKVGILAVSENWLSDAGLSAASDKDDKYAKWTDDVSAAQKWAVHLRTEGAAVVLCLCHNLVSNTQRLAEEVPEVDFFLGGHEHLYAEDPAGRWLIAGFDFDDFCLVTFDVPPGARPQQAPQMQRVQISAESPSADALRAQPLEGKAAALRSLVDHYVAEQKRKLQEPLGVTLQCPLDTRKFNMRTQETSAGNLFADAVFASLQPRGAECCFLIGGIIGCGPGVTPAGPLTLGSVVEWFPWEGGTCIIEVTGECLLQALEHGCYRLPRRFGSFPQVSAIEFAVTVDAAAAEGESGAPFHRISQVMVAGVPLEATRKYKVATTEYIADGGDDYAMFSGAPRPVTAEAAPLLHDAVCQHLLVQGPELHPPPVSGRIKHMKTFNMHVEPEEIGATSFDPQADEIAIKAFAG